MAWVAAPAENKFSAPSNSLQLSLLLCPNSSLCSMADSKEPITEGVTADVVATKTDSGDDVELATKRSRLQAMSDFFTILCAGFALISDGYQNNLMTMSNVLFRTEYPKEYTSDVSTRVSNALLVGEVLGQVVIGVTCDYMGRKTAIVLTTMLIVVGGILATASHGVTIDGMFWMLTISRGIVGFGAGKSCAKIFKPAKRRGAN